MLPQMSELKVRKVPIRLHRAGRGPTVLFLHGAGGVPQWLPFFDALAERYELLVPEHPGFGDSADPPWIRSMADLAMFYLDLVEEAGLDPVRAHFSLHWNRWPECARQEFIQPERARQL